MRLGSSKWQQLGLVCITILCALALGYGVALLTGGNVTPSEATDLPPALGAALVETATISATEALATPAATITPSASAAAVSPSARPAPTATRQAAQAEPFVIEDFDSATSSFLTRETSTWSAGVVDGQYQLKLNGQQNIGFTTPLPVDNYRLSFDLTVEQGGAGLVFLFAEPSTTYRILIAPDGAYALEHQDENEATQLVGWTESTALRRGPGAVNQLQIERRGNQMRFLANGQLLTEYTIPAEALESRYGFVLTSRSGQGLALFDNLRGERLPNS